MSFLCLHFFLGNIQEYFILDIKLTKFINYSTNMCLRNICKTLIKIIKKILKYFESIKSCVLSTSHEYVVRVTIFFECVTLNKLNALEDE